MPILQILVDEQNWKAQGVSKMQRQTGQGMDMKPNTSNNEPTVFCGICKRHETKNENVLCGRDGEQCAKCAGIEQGYAKALDDVEKKLIHAYSVLENNRRHFKFEKKKDQERITRDLDQREDEIGLIYAEIKDISYNQAIEELKEKSEKL